MSGTSRNNNTTAGRLSTLEEGQRSQGREIQGLRHDFQAFAAEIRHALAERSRFPWPAIAVIVAILGGLISLGAWGPLREQERQGEGQRIHREELTDLRIQQAVDRALIERIDAENKSTKDEMKANAGRVEALDARVRVLEDDAGG